MTSNAKRRVLFVLEWLPEYRVRFFELLGRELDTRGIQVDVVYGKPPASIAQHGDSRSLPWGKRGINRYFRLGRKHVVLQPWLREVKGADLVVVNEGTRFLLNSWLLAKQRFGGARIALWGHGANLNDLDRSRLAEYLKRYLYSMPHWWFAYTEGSRRRVLATGFPAERATVVYNSTAGESLRADLRKSAAARPDVLDDLGVEGRRVCLFLGSLRQSRRLSFLLQASDTVVAAHPDFSLVIAGDGPERARVEALAAGRTHVQLAGRVDGMRKAALLSASWLLLLPGHVGLNLVDGFAAGVPTATVAMAQHAPEVEYLVDGHNGLIMDSSASAESFGRAVAALLGDEERLAALARGATLTGLRYTEENMVQRFVDGIEMALNGAVPKT